IGTRTFVWPQRVTQTVSVEATKKVAASAGVPGMSGMEITASKVQIKVGDFSVTVQPTGVSVDYRGGEKMLEITPAMSRLKQQDSQVVVQQGGVTIRSMTNNLKFDSTGAILRSQSIKLG